MDFSFCLNFKGNPMKLITRGNTQLIESAYLSHNGVYAKLLINTRDKWPVWNDIGMSVSHSVDFPQQLAAFDIEDARYNRAVLIIVPDGSEHDALLPDATPFYNLEKDQLAIVWLPDALELQHFTQVCSLGNAS
jgi:hypothetical protein